MFTARAACAHKGRACIGFTRAAHSRRSGRRPHRFSGCSIRVSSAAAVARSAHSDKEVVKPGSPILPSLGPPEPASGSLIFQDWLELLHNPMRDLSNSSHVWWAHVLQVSREAYTRWCVAGPLDRLSIEPQQQGSASGRWIRVNSRACGMILEALEPSVKAHILAHRATGVAACLLFRLFTMYQPGGGAERWLVLRSLQSPCLIRSVHSGVVALRDWGRWHRRCVECGMMVPDPMILARALTEMTRGVLEGHSDAAFRVQCARATLRIDQHPSGEEVLTYHRHLLAEFETLALAQPEVSGGKVAEVSNSGEQAMKVLESPKKKSRVCLPGNCANSSCCRAVAGRVHTVSMLMI